MGLIITGVVVAGGGLVFTLGLYRVWVRKYRRTMHAIDGARIAAEEALQRAEESLGALRSDIDDSSSSGPIFEPEEDPEPGPQLRRYIEGD